MTAVVRAWVQCKIHGHVWYELVTAKQGDKLVSATLHCRRKHARHYRFVA